MKPIVPALYRGLEILELLSKEGLGFNELKEKLSIPKPSLSALLKQLTEKEYIEKNSENRKYRLGGKLLTLSTNLLDKMDIRQKGREEIEKLREECEETVELSILDRGEVLFIDKLESPQSIRLYTQIGRRFRRLHSSAPGKVALAWMSDEERESFFSKFKPLPACTSYTITDKEELLKQLERIRQEGYSWDRDEAKEGVVRFASPIFNYRGELAGIISIAGPSFRIKMGKKKEFVSLVKTAALRISRKLGYRAENNVAETS